MTPCARQAILGLLGPKVICQPLWTAVLKWIGASGQKSQARCQKCGRWCLHFSQRYDSRLQQRSLFTHAWLQWNRAQVGKGLCHFASSAAQCALVLRCMMCLESSDDSTLKRIRCIRCIRLRTHKVPERGAVAAFSSRQTRSATEQHQLSLESKRNF